MIQFSAICFALAVGFLSAQQVDTVDLTTPPVQSKESGKQALPAGCKELSPGGIFDGWVKPDDHGPRHIAVEVIETKDLHPAVGSEVEAVVQLRNDDAQPILIPWSTNPDILEGGQKPNSLQWEGATFEFTLTDRNGHRVALKSLTGWLNGSSFSPGSQLELHHGQSIAALIKFKLEELYPIEPLILKEGTWQLSAKWYQVARTWNIKNCAVWNAYFQYDDFYAQQNPALTIHVSSPKPAEPKQAKPQ